MKYLVTLLALLLAGTAFGGPIRDRLAARWQNRPGVIFPHRTAPACGQAVQQSSCVGNCASCPACDQCPGGVCPLPSQSYQVQPGVVARPVATVRYITVCQNGKCVLVPVRE